MPKLLPLSQQVIDFFSCQQSCIRIVKQWVMMQLFDRSFSCHDFCGVSDRFDSSIDDCQCIVHTILQPFGLFEIVPEEGRNYKSVQVDRLASSPRMLLHIAIVKIVNSFSHKGVASLLFWRLCLSSDADRYRVGAGFVPIHYWKRYIK
jgi:hypothetical protein